MLDIEHQSIEEANSPYTFHLRLVGFFNWIPDIVVKDPEKAFKVNGPSILYGIAREIVRTETARGPFPSVTLPSASFIHLADEVAKEAE